MFRIQPGKNTGQPSLKLTGELTIYAVTDARKELAKQLAKHKDLELDLGGVDEIDTAGVQLLLWLKRSAAAAGSVLTLVQHSSSVMEVLDLLKVTTELGDPILIVPSNP